MSNQGLIFNHRLVEVARNLIQADWNESFGEIRGQIQQAKRESTSIGQPHYADRKVAELWGKAIKELGDIAWGRFIDVFSKSNILPFPDLESNMKRWVGHEIISRMNGVLGEIPGRYQDIVRGAGNHALRKAGAEIDHFINSHPFATSSSREGGSRSVSVFIDPTRLAELRVIRSEQFDLTRLIRLCEEANISYGNECYYAVAMLTRTILDHVSPIFGFPSFRDVASQYNGGKSFKEVAQELEKITRRIADSHLHGPIRDKEVLPTRTQVDKSQAVDFILAEVVRLLSQKPT